MNTYDGDAQGTSFYWVKNLAGFWPAGAPLAAMQAGKVDLNYWWGEFILLIPGMWNQPARLYAPPPINIAAPEAPPNIELIDVDWVRQELQLRVVAHLRNHFYGIVEATKRQDLYPQSFDLLDSAKGRIYPLIMNGEFVSELGPRVAEMKPTALREFLSLLIKHIHETRQQPPNTARSTFE